MKRLVLSALTIIFAVSLIGCNTFKGAGKDVENTGKNIQKTVEKND